MRMIRLAVSWLVAAATVARAQETPKDPPGRTVPVDQATVRVYHGAQDQTRILRRAVLTRGEEFADGLEIVRPKKSKVCVAIDNANPLFYDYSVTAKVDSSAVLPDLSFVKLASGLVFVSQAKAGAEKPGASDWLQWLMTKLTAVQQADTTAATFIAQSERPEIVPGGVLEDPSDGGISGLRAAKQKLADMSHDAFAYNDPDLRAHVAAALRTATESARVESTTIKGTTAADLARQRFIGDVIRLLPPYAEQVVSRHEQLRKNVDGAATTVVECKDVGDYPMTLSLKIVKRKNARGLRDVGEALVPVRVVPSQVRPQVELALTAVMTYVPNVPSFGIRGGVVTRDLHDGVRARPASFVLLNLGALGADQAFSLGAGFGAAFVSDDRKVVSDVIPFSLHVGFRDVIRLGLGVGISRQAGELKGDARVGEALPKDVKNIEDVIDYRNRLGWFALVTLPGFALKK